MRSPPAVPLRQTIQVPGYGPDIPPLHRPGEGLYGTVPEDVLQIGPHQGARASRASPSSSPHSFSSATLSCASAQTRLLAAAQAQ